MASESKNKDRASKIKKLSMPKKSMAESEADTDLESLGDEGEEGSPAEEASESPEEASAEGDSQSNFDNMLGDVGNANGGNDMMGELDHLSDDDLLSELKKRGLMAKSSPVGRAAESDMVNPKAMSGAKGYPGQSPMPSKNA